MWGRIDGRRVMVFGAPGEMRRSLTRLVLAQRKTATAGLLDRDYKDEQEPLEYVGEELVVVDDDDAPVAIIAIDAIDVLPFGAVGWEFVAAEGEGFTSVDDWRSGHVAYWGMQGAAITDESPVVCLRFHVVGDERPRP